jgi:peptidoglycan/xylan/chitin deacetylase (PgdA/CDA1 family)
MRYLAIFALAMGTLVTGCKKAPQHEALAAATPQPTPTPEATPVPTPEPVVVDKTAQVIVLCYHRFEDKPKDSLAINPADFEAEMQALKDAGISVIPMEDLLAWRRGEKSIPPKSAVITIDDGYLSGYNIAWPILKKFGYPFTMFVYLDYIKGGPKSGGQSITWDQLAEMRDAGVDIGSHTVSHTGLNARRGKTDEQYRAWLKNEIATSKEVLESKLGIQVKTIAYPYGMHNEVVRQVVKDAGYEAAFTVYGQHMSFGGDPTMLGRYAVESTKPEIFKAALAFKGSGAGNDASAITAIPASATMLTEPMDGDTISDPQPEIKANLATMGDLDPKSVTMRLSGFGPVPAVYDPKTKTISYKLQQKLRSPDMTVIVSGQVGGGRKVETRWSFRYDPSASATPAPAATASPKP